MEIKITPKGLSIPPYVSTHWSKIQSLHLKGNALCVSLQSGESLLVPNLSKEILNQVFQAHALFLDQEISSPLPTPLHGIEHLQSMFEQMSESPIRLAIGSSLDGMDMITQHNPADINAPDLPIELLQKVRGILDFIPPGKSLQIPQANPSCNCFHCQITRTLNNAQGKTLPTDAVDTFLELVKDEELLFEQWDVRQIDAQRFAVTNKLDSDETYNVFLGETVGCTCGKQGKEACQHILAALRS